MSIRKFALIVYFVLVLPTIVYAHCDTMGGPVVSDAMQALEKGDVAPVLKWVSQENEQTIKDAFTLTTKVRSLDNKEAKEIADRYFLETLVRIHREGEGAPFTGLKPAGMVEPPIAAADKAIMDKSVESLTKTISGAVAHAIESKFQDVIVAKEHVNDSVEAGRNYVDAYVKFVHYVEGIHDLTANNAHHEHK